MMTWSVDAEKLDSGQHMAQVEQDNQIYTEGRQGIQFSEGGEWHRYRQCWTRTRKKRVGEKSKWERQGKGERGLCVWYLTTPVNMLHAPA